jgi:hypothetical protein
MNGEPVKATPADAGTDPIGATLAHLRAWTRRAGALRGAAAFVTAAAGVFAGWFLVDYLFHLEWGHRVVVWLAGAVFLGVLFHREVLRRIWVPLSDEDLALILEKRNPGLDCRLISAVQFRRILAGGKAPFSEDLARRTVGEAVEAVGTVRVGEVFDRRELKKRSGRAGLALAGVLLFLLAFPGTGRIWFLRNVFLYDLDWPRDTYLEIEGSEGGVLRIPRGEDLVLLARVTRGVRPSKAVLSFSSNAGTSGRVDMSVVEEGRYKGTLKNVMDRLTVVVRAGDGRTAPCTVEVVERPVVEALAIRTEVPPHTGLPSHTLEGAAMDLSVPFGTVLDVSGRSSKDLAKIWLDIPPGVRVEGRTEGGRTFRARVLPAKGGFLEIGIVDEDGLRCADPVRLPLRVLPDRAPRVGLRLKGIGDRITAHATVPLHVVVRDDYGVLSLVLEHSAEAKKAKEGKVEGSRDVPGLAAGTKDQVLEDRLEVKPLGLKPGMFLRLQVAALDGDELMGPNEGRSEAFVLGVVSAEDLYALLVGRQQEQRRAFEQILEAEEAIRRLFTTLGEEVLAGKGLDGPARETLADLVRDQRGVQGRVALVAEQFDHIRREMLNNRLGDAKEHRRLTRKIIEPLRDLTTVGLHESLEQLKAVSRTAGEKERLASVRKTLWGLDAILRQMRAILANMLKQESLSEIITALRTLLKAQEDLADNTREEHKRRLKKLLEDD